ncbi:MAG: polysaccharide biosynthesis/export family protein [Terracidiphilus sp.]
MTRRTMVLLALAACALLCRAQSPKPDNSTGNTPTANSVPAAGQPPSAPGVTDSYIIGLSDVLTVTVWKQPTLSSSLLVRPDGKVSMPLLGDLQAAGLKPMQLAAQITEKLKKFMKDPQVSVVVSSIHNNYVYLLGEVGKKGPVVITPGMTLLEAISSGGGLTDFANKKKIYILRTVDGKQQRIPVDYKKALKGDESYNVSLQPGDTIVVP